MAKGLKIMNALAELMANSKSKKTKGVEEQDSEASKVDNDFKKAVKPNARFPKAAPKPFKSES